MKTILEPGRDIPVIRECDLVVIGGSCTGVFAAVRAARLGLSVAVIEKQNCFGGVATAGLVNVWHSLYDTEGSRPIIGGLTREVVERLKKRGAVSENSDSSIAFQLNTEELKIELDELVTESGVAAYLHTFYAAPVLLNGFLDAVMVENKNGRQAIRARQFIDASGDGHLLKHVGVDFEGEPPFQPPTSCCKLAGASSLRGFDLQKAIREHGAEFGLPKDWGWAGPIPGAPDVQFRADGHVFDLDTSDADQLTRAEFEGRRQARAILDLIRRYGPPGADIALIDLAAEIGVRETLRMKAAYRVTGDDVLSGRRFDDAIANGSYRVDIHHSDEPGITFRYLDGRECVFAERGLPPEWSRWRDPLPEDPTFYQVPFRAVLQARVPNLVAAGRMICSDRIAFSALRVMVNLNQLGEAAGVACAMALREGRAPGELDPQALRKTLAEGGSEIV